MVTNLKIITGIILIVIAVFSGVVIEWQFDKDWTKLYSDGNLIAQEKWVVHAERTFIVKDSWYDTNVKCPKIIENGGYETATRCYYVDDYYEQLKRSLIKTKIELADVNFKVFVTKSTPHYKYGTRGSYAGYIIEEMTFDKRVTDEENFPEQYLINWNPKDTRNYILEWRVESLDDVDLADGIYHFCSYRFGNVKIDLKDDCSKLNYVEITDNNKVSFFFNNMRGGQDLNLKFVDPLWIYNDGEADDSLVLYLNMDGNALDTSGKGNDGTLYGNVNIIPGYENLGYDFDGVDGRINFVPNSVFNVTTDNMTFSAWVYLKGGADIATNWHLFDKETYENYGHMLRVPGYSNTNLLYRSSINGTSSSLTAVSALTRNTWNHIVFTKEYYDATYANTTIYIDGMLHTTGLNYHPLSSLKSFTVSHSTQAFNGTIDEVRIYNRSLTASEVLELYNQTLVSHKIKTHGSAEEVKTYAYGSELLVDGNMENAGVGDWSVGASANLTKQTTNPHSGSQVLRVENVGSNNPYSYQIILTIGKTYRVTGVVRSDGSRIGKLYNSGDIVTVTTSTDWQYFDEMFVAGSSSLSFITSGFTFQQGYLEWDDVSIREVTSQDSDYNLMGHWKFNGNADDSVGSNDGTVSGASIVPGHESLGYDFDGDDYITVGVDSDLEPSSITVSSWIYLKNETATTEIINYRETTNTLYGAYQITDDIVGVTVWNGTSQVALSCGHNLGLNKWTHIILDYNSFTGVLNGYKNGVKICTDTTVGNSSIWYEGVSKLGLFLGSSSTALRPMEGLMDNIRIYNVSLSADEVLRLYNSSKYSYSNKVYGSSEEVIIDESNLISHWKFNGNALDSKGTNDGTVSGASIVPGHESLGYSFDGVNDYIDLSSNVIQGNNGTLSMWVYIKNNVDNTRFFSTDHSGGANYEFRTYSTNSGTVLLYVGNGTASVNFNVDSNALYKKWEHIIWTWEYDGTETTLSSYLNGAFQVSDTVGGTIVIPDIAVDLGRWNEGSQYFNGTMDNIRIYNTSLSATEVLKLYNQSSHSYREQIYGSSGAI